MTELTSARTKLEMQLVNHYNFHRGTGACEELWCAKKVQVRDIVRIANGRAHSMH